MSYYDREYERKRRGSDLGRDDYNPHRPITKRVGIGPRTRIAVETAGGDARYQQDQQIEEKLKREQRNFRLEQLKRRKAEWQRYERRNPRIERSRLRRRDSSERSSSYSSPAPQPSRPFADVVDEVSAAGELLLQESGDEAGSDLDFNLTQPFDRDKAHNTAALGGPEKASDTSHDERAQSGRSHINGQISELSILHSRWLGSSVERGELGGEILLVPVSRDATEKQQAHSMKWYHLKRQMMNFEEFTNAVSNVLQLPEKDQRSVSRLLRDVQRRFEKQRHHGRDLEADCVGDFFLNEDVGNARQAVSVMFFNFPYFSLDPYSFEQMRALTPGSPLHPLRPMLQAHFYATSQERELAQVFTRTPGTSKGHCLHLSQLWCLVVNGSSMITCSRLDISELCVDTIRQREAALPTTAAHVKVVSPDGRSWRVPVSQGMSWPTFLALFEDILANMEQLGSTLRFENHKGIVDGKSWPTVVETALASSQVELKMKSVRLNPNDAAFGTTDEPTDSSSDGDASRGPSTATYPTDGLPRPEISLTPFEKLESIKPAATFALETSASFELFKHDGTLADMRSIADDCDSALRFNSRSSERAAYRKCPKAKLADIVSWLSTHEQLSPDDATSNASVLLRRYKRRLASVSKCLFTFFWPKDFEHSVTDKYWGAINQTLTREDEFFVKGKQDQKYDLFLASVTYRVLHDEILPIALALIHEFSSYEHDLRPSPPAFRKAWLHLLTTFVLIAEKVQDKNTPFSRSSVGKHAHAVVDELLKGKHELGTRLRKVDLEDLEVCDENSLLVMLVNRLSKDNMNGQPDIARAYGDYFQGVEFNILQDPVPRVHQETVRYFQQEVEAILAYLQDQMSVIDAIQQSLEQQRAGDGDPLFEDASGESRRSIVIETCKAWVGGRIDKFKGLQQRARDLGDWHLNQMDTHKDRQEKAILVFTIVTIVFLPLSFVASVFGMNTTDIRDMPYKQWLYWSAGLPLTVVVVIASLWFAGELESIGQWLARTMSRSRAPPGYAELRDLNSEGAELDWRRQGLRRYRDRMEDLEGRYARPIRRTTYPIKDM